MQAGFCCTSGNITMEGTEEESTIGFVCINCGQRAPEVYRQFQGGTLKIAHCVKCGNMVDKYIEYDPVLIFLDALLHKPQTYRHMLYNVVIKWYWKLLVILILCDTYIKWESRAPHSNEASSDIIFYAALEWNFYKMLFYTVSEWAVLVVTFYFCSQMLLEPCPELIEQTTRVRIGTMVKAVTLSSFGKLFLIPAIVWGQSQSTLWLQLTHILVYTSNVCAFKVLYTSGRLKVMLMVIIAHLSPLLIGSNI